jgi:hypothetical protein
MISASKVPKTDKQLFSHFDYNWEFMLTDNMEGLTGVDWPEKSANKSIQPLLKSCP